jgi:hypothetical protein
MALRLGTRLAQRIIFGVAAGVVVGSLFVNLPRLSAGHFWSDGATYYSMAWSLAADGDLQYEKRDVARVRREYPDGPQGIFLKRTAGAFTWDASGFPWVRRIGENEKRVYFAKAFAYPVAAAPFVKLLGTRGLVVCNAVFFALALVLGWREIDRVASPGWGLVLTLVIFFGTVAPLYLLWPTPEIFNFSLIVLALVAWRQDRPILAAILFGIAAFSKPYNILLALPLGVAPMLAGSSTWARRLLESGRRGLALIAVVGALFGVNKVITGEVNYQGGERKTWLRVEEFPFEGRTTFGNSGEWMTTNQAGPKVIGGERGIVARLTQALGLADAERPQGASSDAVPHYLLSEAQRPPEELGPDFVRNLGYFWVGRYSGALWYFAPIVVAGGVFLLAGPRTARGWLGLAALLASYLFYIHMIPDNWYGGSGTIGNRYFINIYPLVLLLVPRKRAAWVAIPSAALGIIFIGPLLAAPMAATLQAGEQTLLPQYKMAPLELTMLNDLSLFSERWRKKQPVGDTEGDAHKHWPADPRAYFLYFPDNGTYGRETAQGGEGFWLRGGRRAEVIVRALEPVTAMNFSLTGGPMGDEVSLDWEGQSRTLSLEAGETREVTLHVRKPGFQHNDTFLYVGCLRSRRGAVVHDPRERRLGTFVRIGLDVRIRKPLTPP